MLQRLFEPPAPVKSEETKPPRISDGEEYVTHLHPKKTLITLSLRNKMCLTGQEQLIIST